MFARREIVFSASRRHEKTAERQEQIFGKSLHRICFSLFYTGLCFGVEFDFLRGYFGQRIVQSDADAALSRLRSVDPDFVPGAGRRDTDLLLREFHFHAVLRLHRRTFEQKFASRLDEDRSIGRRGVGETEIVARFGLDGELRFGIVFLEPLAAFEADYRVRERGGNGL